MKEIKDRTKKDSEYSKIELDVDLCIGAGPCEVFAPKTFEINEEGKAVLLDPDAHDDRELLDAAMGCSVLAIKLYDKDEKMIFPK